jgi:hypothetical protein
MSTAPQDEEVLVLTKNGNKYVARLAPCGTWVMEADPDEIEVRGRLSYEHEMYEHLVTGIIVAWARTNTGREAK